MTASAATRTSTLRSMKSKHAEYFNHDENASGYDRDVSNEDDPIRTGYKALLEWVAEMARINSQSRVLELGSGTGNLTGRLPDCEELVCVDISERMEDLAKQKVSRFRNRRFIKEDILQIFDRPIGVFDVILSTYTVHHLTDAEKKQFFGEVFRHLTENGRAVFGDLMLETRDSKESKIAEYRAKGDGSTADAIEEEFFWFVDETSAALEEVGLTVSIKRFSDLSFGILCEKGDANKSMPAT